MKSVSILSTRPAAANLRLGTAGWAIPKAHSASFPSRGSALARYSAVFNAAEINSTFYRTHRSSTFERWRESVPEDFKFSVKIPKTISHEMRLVGAAQAFEDFGTSLGGLGRKLGPLLLQLPPKLAFDEETVRLFLGEITSAGSWTLVLEPRHETWFTSEANDLLKSYSVTRAGADPERAQGALRPGGSENLAYVRLHGSPHVYFSSYDEIIIRELLFDLKAKPFESWCIFDNTASGAAAGDAIRMKAIAEGSAS